MPRLVLERVVQAQTIVVQALDVDARMIERRQTGRVPRRTRCQLALRTRTRVVHGLG